VSGISIHNIEHWLMTLAGHKTDLLTNSILCYEKIMR